VVGTRFCASAARSGVGNDFWSGGLRRKSLHLRVGVDRLVTIRRVGTGCNAEGFGRLRNDFIVYVRQSILVLLLLLVACAPAEPAAVAPTQPATSDATATTTVARVPTDTAVSATQTAVPATATITAPTDVPATATVVLPTATEVVSTYDGMPQGFTEAGAPALGAAAADVEMIDYSDFL